MPNTEVDSIELKVKSDADKATESLDKLLSKMNAISKSIGNISKQKIGIDLSISGGSEKTINRMEQFVQKASKRMQDELQKAFNIDPSKMSGIKEASDKIAGRYAKDGNARSSEIKELANEITRAKEETEKLDSEWQMFYDTVKKTGKINVSENLPSSIGDAWKDMHGMLRQKLNASGDGIELDSIFQEWRTKFSGLFDSSMFKDFNLDNVEDQFRAVDAVLKDVDGQFSKIEQDFASAFGDNDPMAEMKDTIAQMSPAINSFAEEVKNARRVINETGGETITEGTGFKDIAASLKKIGDINLDNLLKVSDSISGLASGISALNNVSFNPTPIMQAAEQLKTLSGDKLINGINNLTSVGNQISTFASQLSSLNGLEESINGIKSFEELANGVKKLGNKGVTEAIANITPIANGINELILPMQSIGSLAFDASSLISLADGVSALGRKSTAQAIKNMPEIGSKISSMVTDLNKIGSIKFDVSGLSELTSSISKLGGKNSGNAPQNINKISVALKDMMKTLSNAPHVSKNVIKMTEAMAKLTKNGGRVSKSVNGIAPKLNHFASSARNTEKKTRSLSSSLGTLYAKFWALERIASKIFAPVEKSMNYLETFNYFDAAFGQVGSKATGDWKKLGYESANEYMDSFSKRARELTAKMSGFNISDNGLLRETTLPSMGMDTGFLMNTQATFGQVSSSIGVASEQALKLSNALTMIGADLASVKNEDFDKVYDNLTSGLVGMSRAVDKYGINIRNANMEQYAHNLGIEQSVSKWGQADKAMLRTIMILDSTRYAWSDMSKTINLPANQLRMLKQNFISLSRSIGNIFLPVIATVLPYINGITIALRRLTDFIGRMLGVEDKLGALGNSIGSNSDVLSGALDSLEDAETPSIGEDLDSSLSSAEKNAKKLNKWLAGFDELEVMNIRDDTDYSKLGKLKGDAGIGDYSNILGAALDDILEEYTKKWNEAFNSMDNKAVQFANKVTNAFKKLAAAAKPTTEALSKLWNNGLKKFRDFTWKGLEDFWKYFLKPLGKWTLGENGLPRLINAFDKFLVDIHWDKINESLVNLWDALEPFAEKVGEGLLNFFDDFFEKASKVVNGLPDGINKLADMIRGIKPETAEKLGYGLGVVLTSLTSFKGLSWIGKILGSNGIINSGLTALAKHPFITMAAGFCGIAVGLDRIGVINLDWEAIKKGVEKIKDAIFDFAKKINWQAVIDAVGNLASVLPEMAEGFLSISADIINGIGTALGWVAEKVSEMEPETLEAIGKGFGVIAAVKIGGDLIGKITGLGSAFTTLAGGIKTLALCAAPLAGFKLAELISVKFLGGEKKSVSEFVEDNIIGYKSGDIVGAFNEFWKDQVINRLHPLNAEDFSFYENAENAVLSMVRSSEITAKQGFDIITYLDDLERGCELSSMAVYDLQSKFYSMGISYEAFESAMSNISNPIAETGEAAAKTGTTVTDMADKLNLVSFDGIAEQLTNFQTLLQTVDFATIVSDTANAIDEMGGIWENGKQILGEKALQIQKEIENGLEPDENGYYHLANGQMVEYGKGITDYESKLQTTLDTTLQNAITNALPDGYELCRGKGAEHIQGYTDGLEEAVSGTDSKVGNILNGVWEIQKTPVKAGGKELGKNFNSGLVNGINESKSLVSTATTNLLEDYVKKPAANAVQSHSPSVWFENLAKFCGQGFGNGLEPGFAPSFTFFRNFSTRINNCIGSLRGIGYNAIIGMNNGMVEASNKLFENVRKIAGSIPNIFRNVLKIHSPSVVMGDIAGNTMDGLINRFEKMAPRLDSVVGNLAFGIEERFSAMVPAIQDNMSGMQINMQTDTHMIAPKPPQQAVSNAYSDEIRREILSISSNVFNNNQNVGQAVKEALDGMAVYADGELIGYLQKKDKEYRMSNEHGLFEKRY